MFLSLSSNVSLFFLLFVLHSLSHFSLNNSFCLFFLNVFFYLSALTCVHYCFSIFPSNLLLLTFPSITLSLFFISSHNSTMLVCLFSLSFFAILFTFCLYLLSEEETQSVPISLNVSLPCHRTIFWRQLENALKTENWKLKKNWKKVQPLPISIFLSTKCNIKHSRYEINYKLIHQVIRCFSFNQRF